MLRKPKSCVVVLFASPSSFFLNMLSSILDSVYEGRRSASLLKIKTFYDAEAIVTGHAPGKGRNKGITGALKCKMESGKVRFLSFHFVSNHKPCHVISWIYHLRLSPFPSLSCLSLSSGPSFLALIAFSPFTRVITADSSCQPAYIALQCGLRSNR